VTNLSSYRSFLFPVDVITRLLLPQSSTLSPTWLIFVLCRGILSNLVFLPSFFPNCGFFPFPDHTTVCIIALIAAPLLPCVQQLTFETDFFPLSFGFNRVSLILCRLPGISDLDRRVGPRVVLS